MKTNVNASARMIGVIISTLLVGVNSMLAQEKHLAWRLGLEGGMTFIGPDDVNRAIDELFSSSAVIFTQGSDEMKLGFNVTGYVGLVASDLIEIRPEVGFLIAPKFINISGGNDLDIIITAVHPGISVNLRPKTRGSVRPQFGVGLFQYFSSIKWDDKVDPFTWKGNKLGLHVVAGMEVKMLPNLGISLTALWRRAQIDELKDENDQVVVWLRDGKNFSLDLSGIELRAGGYLAF